MVVMARNTCEMSTKKSVLWTLLAFGFLLKDQLLVEGLDRVRNRPQRPSRVVHTKQGRLQGTLIDLQIQSTATAPLMEDLDDSFSRQVEVYKGIPFAAPPVGSLRFVINFIAPIYICQEPCRFCFHNKYAVRHRSRLVQRWL